LDQDRPASEDIDYEGFVLRLYENRLESSQTRSPGTDAKASLREIPTVLARDDITITPPRETPASIEGTKEGACGETPCEEVPPPLLLYVPTLTPFDFQKVLDAVPSVTRDEERLKRLKKAERWLKDSTLYHSLFRRLPKKNRAHFRNENMTQHKEALIGSGILERTTRDKIKSFVKLFTADEPGKPHPDDPDSGRMRLICEPRDLNAILQGTFSSSDILPKVVFPTINELQRAAARNSTIAQSDWKCFYYQILLGESVREYYGVQIGDEYFRMTRLPMGGVPSCFVAQEISVAIKDEAMTSVEDVNEAYVQIDNIYFFGNACTIIGAVEEITSRIGLAVGSWANSDEDGAVATALGMEFDMQDRTVKLSQKFRRKHQRILLALETRNRISALELWYLMGIIIRVAMVLRKPPAGIYYLMNSIRRLARRMGVEARPSKQFWAADCGWNDIERNQAREAIRFINRWTSTTLPFTETRTEVFLISDACDEGGATVTIINNNITINEWRWADEQRKLHINEKEALTTAAVTSAIAATPKGRGVVIVTDSQVVASCLLKGMSRNKIVNTAVNRSISRVSGNDVKILWIPSEWNPSDGPSRGLQPDWRHFGEIVNAVMVAPSLHWG